MKKRPTVSDRSEIGRQSTGRGGTRRDTKNGWVTVGALVGGIVRKTLAKRDE